MGRVQQNAVLVKGKQTVIIVAMKSTEASTLDVVDGIKKMIPRAEQVSPPGVKIKLLDDASTFVKDSISDVVHEMATAGALVGLIVLLLLGSWRATVIVWTSIPLSILTAIIGLHWLNETINVMTLGGLALAVGILVDDATVMIENIDRHLEMGKPLEQAIIDAANQIVVPDSRRDPLHRDRLDPALRAWWRRGVLVQTYGRGGHHRHAGLLYSVTHVGANDGEIHHEESPCRSSLTSSPRRSLSRNVFVRFQKGFERRFDQFREGYGAAARTRDRPSQRLCENLAGVRGGIHWSSSTFLGRDYFPEIRSGVIQMHMRAPLGTRIEVAGRLATLVSNSIEVLPGQVENIVSNCGLPVGPHNLAFIPLPRSALRIVTSRSSSRMRSLRCGITGASCARA